MINFLVGMPMVFNDIVHYLIVFIIPIVIVGYFILAIYQSRKYLYQFSTTVITYLPPALFTLIIAYMAYMKANDFLNTSILFQISDRCLVRDVKIDEKIGKIYPMFINQGGDALAYGELVKNKNERELRNDAQKHLQKIYDNIDASDKYFRDTYFEVCRSNSAGQWVFNKAPQSNSCSGDGSEEWEEFDVLNVIGQLKHPGFWTTRAKCAKLLQNTEYLRNIKNFNKINLEKLTNEKVEEMFNNLISNISDDYSLMVRKISLDTYKLWACVDQDSAQGPKKQCEDQFVSNNIYNFEKAVAHWNDQASKARIINNFKLILTPQ